MVNARRVLLGVTTSKSVILHVQREVGPRQKDRAGECKSPKRVMYQRLLRVVAFGRATLPGLRGQCVIFVSLGLDSSSSGV